MSHPKHTSHFKIVIFTTTDLCDVCLAGSLGLISTHLEKGIQEYLSQRLWHSKMAAVAGADLKGGLQTLYGNCGGGSVRHYKMMLK